MWLGDGIFSCMEFPLFSSSFLTGFLAQPYFLTPRNARGHYDALDLKIVDIRSTIEHVNGRFKKLGCFYQIFRHDIEKHKLLVELNCQLLNFTLNIQPVQKIPKSSLIA